MSVFHRPLVVSDTDVGDLVTVGSRVVLFTTRPELTPLDGRTFDTIGSALDAAAKMLGAVIARFPAAEPASAA